jgi:hypothetical protein
MRINRRNKDVKNTLGRFHPVLPFSELPPLRIAAARAHVTRAACGECCEDAFGDGAAREWVVCWLTGRVWGWGSG